MDLQDPHLDSAMALRIKSKKQPKVVIKFRKISHNIDNRLKVTQR